MNGVTTDVLVECFFFATSQKNGDGSFCANSSNAAVFFSRNEVLKYTNWCIVVPLVVVADVQKDR